MIKLLAIATVIENAQKQSEFIEMDEVIGQIENEFQLSLVLFSNRLN